MTIDQGIAFLIFALVAAITPGPSNVMIAATGSLVGFGRGLACALGAAAGMASLLFLSALGLGQIVLAHPDLLRALNVGGALFLLWLAWKIASAGPARETDPPSKPVGFLGAALFQWTNPKGWLVAVGAAGTYLQGSASQITQAVAFGTLFFAAALPSGIAWLALGALIRTALRDARAARAFNVVMGLTLAASVFAMLR
jgi:threonine/homoserine/homoserine lactone efflux protein